jgi:hypothetical protein
MVRTASVPRAAFAAFGRELYGEAHHLDGEETPLSLIRKRRKEAKRRRTVEAQPVVAKPAVKLTLGHSLFH